MYVNIFSHWVTSPNLLLFFYIWVNHNTEKLLNILKSLELLNGGFGHVILTLNDPTCLNWSDFKKIFNSQLGNGNHLEIYQW